MGYDAQGFRTQGYNDPKYTDPLQQNQLTPEQKAQTISLCAHEYFSTCMKYSQIIRNVFACVSILCVVCLIMTKIFYDNHSYLFSILTYSLVISIILSIIFSGRYMVIDDIYNKINKHYPKHTTYYIDMGKYLYDPSNNLCPFLDDLFIIHFVVTISICMWVLLLGMLWLFEDINNKSIAALQTILVFIIGSSLFLVGDYLIFRHIMSNISSISVPHDQTSSLTKWIKINYRIDVNLDPLNINTIKYHSPVDILSDINNSLKKVVE